MSGVLKKLKADVESMERFSHLPELQERLQASKDAIARIEQREQEAFAAGWFKAYQNVSWGHDCYTKHERKVGYNLWLGLDAYGTKNNVYSL